MWVSPFRDPWLPGYLLLPTAFRSLSRLSSALSAKASTLRSFQLNLIVFQAVGRCGWTVQACLLTGLSVTAVSFASQRIRSRRMSASDRLIKHSCFLARCIALQLSFCVYIGRIPDPSKVNHEVIYFCFWMSFHCFFGYSVFGFQGTMPNKDFDCFISH